MTSKTHGMIPFAFVFLLALECMPEARRTIDSRLPSGRTSDERPLASLLFTHSPAFANDIVRAMRRQPFSPKKLQHPRHLSSRVALMAEGDETSLVVVDEAKLREKLEALKQAVVDAEEAEKKAEEEDKIAAENLAKAKSSLEAEEPLLQEKLAAFEEAKKAYEEEKSKEDELKREVEQAAKALEVADTEVEKGLEAIKESQAAVEATERELEALSGTPSAPAVAAAAAIAILGAAAVTPQGQALLEQLKR